MAEEEEEGGCKARVESGVRGGVSLGLLLLPEPMVRCWVGWSLLELSSDRVDYCEYSYGGWGYVSNACGLLARRTLRVRTVCTVQYSCLSSLLEMEGLGWRHGVSLDFGLLWASWILVRFRFGAGFGVGAGNETARIRGLGGRFTVWSILILFLVDFSWVCSIETWAYL